MLVYFLRRSLIPSQIIFRQGDQHLRRADRDAVEWYRSVLEKDIDVVNGMPSSFHQHLSLIFPLQVCPALWALHHPSLRMSGVPFITSLGSNNTKLRTSSPALCTGRNYTPP